jgi:hypothetical protein
VSQKGYDRAIFASNYLSLIQQIKAASQDRSSIGSVVLDIKQLVAGFLLATF